MKGLLIFLAGAAAGAIGTLIYVRKKLVPEIKDEMYRLAEEELQMNSPEPTYDASEYVSEDKEPQPVIKTVKLPTQTYVTATDYTNYSKTAVVANKFVEVQEQKAEVEPEPNATQSGGTDPYLIDAGSYDEYSDYNAHTFVMYSDGVVIDDESEEILDADPELVFGKTAIEILKSGKEDIVYVRDDSKKQDYSIERNDFPFDGPTDVYKTFDPNDWGD